jgi:GNAT superfamily N-acetyltransferase
MTQDPLPSRAYAGTADLRAMQDMLVRNAADTDWRAGDLAWAVRENTHFELSLRVRLFTDSDGTLLGWTWVRGRGLIEAELVVTRRDPILYEAMIAAAETTVEAMVRAGDEVGGLRMWISDQDIALRDAVTARGFAASDLALQINRRESLDELPDPRDLPPGWGFAAVDTDERVASRVECHRAAFAPSSLTARDYARVRRTWPYRSELDRVIVDEQDAVVAACTAWLDEANADGLLEPVATRPSDQGRGYGRAVCIDALSLLRSAGARTAQVGCVAGAPACATYASIGFEPVGPRITAYTKPQATVS